MGKEMYWYNNRGAEKRLTMPIEELQYRGFQREVRSQQGEIKEREAGC